MNGQRRCGVVLHVTALPGRGIGTLGDPARDFLDWLERAGATYWQVCPLGPTVDVAAHSPYQSYSSFAGNPLVIDLQDLVERGWVGTDEADRSFDPHRVEFDRVVEFKRGRLRSAFEGFRERASESDRTAFQAFRDENEWVREYALFRALKTEFDDDPWYEWPRPFRERDPDRLEAFRADDDGEMAYRAFCQYVFDRQWRALRADANERGLAIFGDLPIYPALDSVDAWATPAAFDLDSDRRPNAVAGVPPDGDDGQRWGNPVYDWDHLRASNFEWWVRRFERLLELVDVVRVDHFKGFDEFWGIPADSEDPADGEWRPAPGAELFDRLGDEFGDLPVVAEDLGHLTEGVHELRERFSIPGMRVVQYADWCDPDARHTPGDFPADVVAYTGTHDTDTAVGHYRGLEARQRDCLHDRLETDGHEVTWDLIDAVWGSNARVAMTQLQDVLGLGSDARFNTPGTVGGNWTWRVTSDGLDPELADRLRRITDHYDRLRS
jgi:4-alpha-glucanotransferase